MQKLVFCLHYFLVFQFETLYFEFLVKLTCRIHIFLSRIAVRLGRRNAMVSEMNEKIRSFGDSVLEAEGLLFQLFWRSECA